MIIEKGLALNFSDFKDALHYHYALKVDCEKRKRLLVFKFTEAS